MKVKQIVITVNDDTPQEKIDYLVEDITVLLHNWDITAVIVVETKDVTDEQA
jgi:hypothetical protein